MFRRVICGVGLLFATVAAGAASRCSCDERGGVITVSRDGIPFAEIRRTGEIAIEVQCRDDFAFLTLQPARGTERTVRALSGLEIRLTRDLLDARTLGSGGLKPLGEDVGSYAFLAVAEPSSRRGAVSAFVTSEIGSGVIFSEKRDGRAVLKPVVEYGKLKLAAGENVPGEVLALGWFEDCRTGLERYADAVAAHYGIRLNRQMAGYCTYYSDRFDHAGTEASTRELMAFAAEKLVPYGFDFYQIDGSWQNGEMKYQPGQPKDTGPINRRFTGHDPKGAYPNGLKVAADAVKAAGCVPGLWFMPFSANSGDSHFADKRDLFVVSDVDDARPANAAPDDYTMNQRRGAPYETFWGGTALDMTNPRARAYLGANLRRMIDEWGFRYFKYDGIWVGAATKHVYISDAYRPDDLGRQTFRDPKATNMSAFRRAVSFMRETVGPDVFLLGCNCAQNMRVMAGAYGCVDAMRIGPDNNASWDGVCRGAIRGSARWFLNGRVWYNDPDPVYVRDSIPLERARNSATWASFSGQLFASSDWLPDLSEERLEILRRTLAPHRMYREVRPLDVFSSEVAHVWKLEKDGYSIFAFYNWDASNRFERVYSAAELGLDASKTYAAYDFWERRARPEVGGSFPVSVPPQGARVVVLREISRTPFLLSTSRHVASPLFEVADQKWDAGAKTLSGVSKVVPGEPYELRFYLPPGWSVGAFKGGDAQVSAEGRIASVRLVPRGRTVSWSANFEFRTAHRSTDYPTISAAIAACSAAGGGRVVVPAGEWRTGPVVLKSGVELHFEDGARLVFSDKPQDYLPAVPTAQEGVECLNYSPLIYAYGATNVAITGRGVLAPDTGTWREWVPCPYPKGYFAALRKLYDWMSEGVPLEERDLTKLPESNMRPQLIMFNRCKGVRLEDYQVREAPFWTHHLYLCEDVVMRNVDDRAHLNNTDGVDVEGTRNVLIENCTFDQGDDVIVLKAGRNRDGWRLGRPTENVEVRNCTINGGNGVLTVGSEMSGGVRNVYLHDCTVTRETKHVFYVKTNRRRGGFVENVRMKNVKAADALTAISVKTDVLYQWGEFPDHEIRYTPIRNLSVENLSVGACEVGIELLGDGHLPVDGVKIDRFTAERCYRSFKEIRHAKNVAITDSCTFAGSAVADALGAKLLPREYSHVRDSLVKRVHDADLAADRAWLACTTPAAIAARQRELAEKTFASLGGLPERTPLNARTVGTVSLSGCRVEKVIFESMPGFRVTAHLFLPDDPKFAPPYAGIVQAQGHSLGGKDCDLYQRAGLLAARAGYAALVYDPVDQGERVQRERKGLVNVVDEHNDLGKRAVLVGWNTARFRIFDGLRAFDYLASRPDVDANRLAVWGQSGGGTLSSYLMALEPRVRAASPSCYLTSFRSLVQVGPPQDAEQNLFGQLKFGLNHAGWCLLRAPSPECPSVNEGDGFPITGTRETFETVSEIYRRLGAADRFACLENAMEHGWTEAGRVYGLAWFDKWLNGRGERFDARTECGIRTENLGFNLEDHEFALYGDPRGRVAPGGDVRNLPGARSAYGIVAEEAERLAAERPRLTREAFLAFTGINPDVPFVEKNVSSGRSVLMRKDDFTQIPMIVFRPETVRANPVLIVGDAKDRRAETAEVEARLAEGRIVAVVDLRGFRETDFNLHPFYRCPDADETYAMMHYLLGESLVAKRAEDLLVAARKLARETGGAIELVAKGRAAIPAAHARFAAPELFAKLRMDHAPLSWREVLADPQAPYRFADVIHGAYRLYDWTELATKRHD